METNGTENKPWGKARRLAEHLADVAGSELTAQITAGLDLPRVGGTTRDRSAWVRHVIAGMDALLSEGQCREIMARRRCPMPKRMISRQQERWAQCEDLADYARRTAPAWGGDGFSCDGNRLRMRISTGRCYCTLSGSAAEPVGKTHCLCCAAHLRAGLEPTFGLPVDVDVESTVISGDQACWFVAYVGGRANADGPPVRPAVRSTPTRPAPIRTKVAPLPSFLALDADGTRAVALLHHALAAVVTAGTAETPAEQMEMKEARPRMLGALWCLARHGLLRTDGHPRLYQRKREGKRLGIDVADATGLAELTRYHVPGLHTEVVWLKRTSPKDWESVLTAEGPQQGRVVLRLLQRYAEMLCLTHGEPVALGGHRYSGTAYDAFRTADLSVFAV